MNNIENSLGHIQESESLNTKNTLIAALSLAVVSAVGNVGCTSTATQGQSITVVSGYGYQPESGNTIQLQHGQFQQNGLDIYCDDNSLTIQGPGIQASNGGTGRKIAQINGTTYICD